MINRDEIDKLEMQIEEVDVFTKKLFSPKVDRYVIGKRSLTHIIFTFYKQEQYPVFKLSKPLSVSNEDNEILVSKIELWLLKGEIPTGNIEWLN